MHQDGSLPRARRDGLLEEVVGEELLLYDQESHIAHCLSPIAARVWWHCDGEHDLTGLAQLVGASKDLVSAALHELREKDLLVAETELTQSTTPGVSRREAIVRATRYGAAAAAGSLIVSATAATPAMASSGEVENCKTENRCVKETESICCCCEDGTAHTGSSTQTCTTICKDNKGVFKESTEMRAV